MHVQNILMSINTDKSVHVSPRSNEGEKSDECQTRLFGLGELKVKACFASKRVRNLWHSKRDTALQN